MTSIPEKLHKGEKSALMTHNYLMQEYVQKEKSLNQIARGIGCSKKLVLLNIQKHKIPTRSNALARHIRSRRNFTLDRNIKNYFDGLILGDGCILQKNQYSARYNQTFAVRYSDWADKIRSDLAQFGINSNMLEFMTKQRVIRKTGQLIRSFRHVMLFTKFYEDFIYFRDRWYGKGVKTVPEDLELAPITIANWLMGDGYFDSQSGRLAFSTQSASVEDLVLLRQKMLTTLGVYGKVYPDRSQDNQPIFKLSREESKKVLSYTKDFKVSCFDYKWGLN